MMTQRLHKFSFAMLGGKASRAGKFAQNDVLQAEEFKSRLSRLIC